MRARSCCSEDVAPVPENFSCARRGPRCSGRRSSTRGGGGSFAGPSAARPTAAGPMAGEPDPIDEAEAECVGLEIYPGNFSTCSSCSCSGGGRRDLPAEGLFGVWPFAEDSPLICFTRFAKSFVITVAFPTVCLRRPSP